MMMISDDAGCRLFEQSVNPTVRNIDGLDAFSEGTEMLLKAMIDQFDTPSSTPAMATIITLSASKTIASGPDISLRRAHLEAAAARFQDPLASTVTCIRPSGRSAFAL